MYRDHSLQEQRILNNQLLIANERQTEIQELLLEEQELSQTLSFCETTCVEGEKAIEKVKADADASVKRVKEFADDTHNKVLELWREHCDNLEHKLNQELLDDRQALAERHIQLKAQEQDSRSLRTEEEQEMTALKRAQDDLFELHVQLGNAQADCLQQK